MPSYVYQDAEGHPLYRVVRSDSGKTFYQQHWTGSGWAKGLNGTQPVPYNLPRTITTADRGVKPIWIFEGEKDVDNAIEAYRVVATTNSGGAGKWEDHHTRWLAGAGAEQVIICYDNDEKGWAHAWKVHDSLRRHGITDIHFRRAREGKDITDHINAGLAVRDLVREPPPRVQQYEGDNSSTGSSDEEFLPASFQLALYKLRERGPVSLEDAESQQYNAVCPAHDDNSPSLTLRPGEVGRDSVGVLVECFAGCTAHEIAQALDIDPKEFTEIEQAEETKLQRRVEIELINQKARAEAKRIIANENRNVELATFSDDDFGDKELLIPVEPEEWLVQDWFTNSSTMLLVADAKAGKTRLCMNLMQSLTENKPFLGKYQTFLAEGARVCYLNYDMRPDRFRRYLKEYTWANPNQFIIKHFVGNQFPFWQTEVFERFKDFALKSNIQLLIMDTLQMASQGFVVNENDNTEMASFVGLMRQLVDACCIPHLLVTHHRGRSKEEHARGASSLDGAFDGWWTLKADDRESHDAPRYLSARGRGVGQSAIELDYNEATETYTTEGKAAGTTMGRAFVDKTAIRFAEFCRNVKAFYDEEKRWPGATVSQRKLMSGDGTKARAYLDEAISLGYVLESRVGGRKLVSLTDKGLAAVNADR